MNDASGFFSSVVIGSVAIFLMSSRVNRVLGVCVCETLHRSVTTIVLLSHIQACTRDKSAVVIGSVSKQSSEAVVSFEYSYIFDRVGSSHLSSQSFKRHATAKFGFKGRRNKRVHA
jgi:hypothetical protein